MSEKTYDFDFYLYKVKVSASETPKYLTLWIAAESFEKALEIANEWADGDMIVSIEDKNKEILVQKKGDSDAN